MRPLLVSFAVATMLTAGTAQAGNTSSNSSSNSSNGVHTRVDTLISDDGRGRRFYERRFRSRDDGYRGRYGYRERGDRYRYGSRRWRGDDDDD